MKLTKARREMLHELNRNQGKAPYAEHYAPLRWLCENGLATMTMGGYGSALFQITPADRRALQENEHGR